MKNKDDQFEELKQHQLQKLASRIKDLRIKKGYTSYEYFAYDHNIPRDQYSRYEKGEDLKFSSWIKILNALDISLKEFFNEEFTE